MLAKERNQCWFLLLYLILHSSAKNHIADKPRLERRLDTSCWDRHSRSLRGKTHCNQCKLKKVPPSLTDLGQQKTKKQQRIWLHASRVTLENTYCIYLNGHRSNPLVHYIGKGIEVTSALSHPVTKTICVNKKDLLWRSGNIHNIFIQIQAHCFPVHIFFIMILAVKEKTMDRKRENDNLSPLAL